MNYQILINKNHLYQPQDFANIKFVSFLNCESKEEKLEQKTYQAFLGLKKALLEEGIELLISPGGAYRSVETQEEIKKEFRELYGDDYAQKFVAPPGMSEHHTGLCFDVCFKKNGKLYIKNEDLLKAENEETWNIIHALLSRYGLILRYPKNKEALTMYPYEPWHFRYVGKWAAKAMEEKKLVLEEYVALYKRSGILVIDKPKGITSRAVVDEVSHLFQTKKVGHTGTLDPLATGVLVVTVNQATKLTEYLMATKKEYIATVKMGVQTDTLDDTGTVLQTSPVPRGLPLKEILQKWQKTYLQEVPLYSAVKVAGKKLYEYARNKEKVALPKKEVTIYEMELLEAKETEFTFRCVVSKGTYIRSLIRDIGHSLGVPMTMTALTRTKQGRFQIEDAEELKSLVIETVPLIPMTEVLPFPLLEMPLELSKQIRNGMTITGEFAKEEQVGFLVGGALVAIYKRENKQWRPAIIFAS